MPNWVFNTLTIEGPKLEIDFIKAKLNEPFTVLHDNWLMDTNKMEVTEAVYSAPVFAFWNIHSPLQDGITMEEYVGQPKKLGIDINSPDWYSKEVEHAKTQKDWYNWNTSKWGTKWDVAVSDGDKYPDTELVEYMSEGDTNCVIYKFNTAWSPAVTVLIKLSNLVPNSLLTLEFEEETGWGGEYEIRRGEVKELLEYTTLCRDCDEIDTLDYCDNDCGEICSSCHWMGEADLEAVKKCQTHKIYLDNVPEHRTTSLITWLKEEKAEA